MEELYEESISKKAYSIVDCTCAQVATASTTLKIVEDLPEEKKSFSLLTIGDSLSCNTATYERLNELTDNKIIYMGTRGVGGSLTEARRGFSAANYLTDAPYTMEEPHEKVQPFYNEKTGSFDWRRRLSRVKCSHQGCSENSS